MNQTFFTSPKFVAHRRESDGAIQSLENHLHAVGKISARNASKLKVPTVPGIPQATLEAIGEVIGLLHDLGKYSKAFQDYLGSAVGLIDQDADDYVNAAQLRGRIDHSTAGAQFIWQELSKISPHGPLCAQILALCIASHHSGLIDCIAPAGEDNFTRRLSKAEESAHLQEVLAQANTSVLNRVAELISTSDFVENLQKMALSIVQLEHGNGRSEAIVQVKLGLLVRFLFSCLIDADRVDTADFEHFKSQYLRQYGKYTDWEILIARLETYLANFPQTSPVTKLRHEVSEHCRLAAQRRKGLFTLTVPTGGGKTLASLRFALHHAAKYGLDRVIYVIPFTSIIDQNAEVVRGILEPVSDGIDHGSIVLEHHSNLTPDEQTWRSKILSENWDAPVIFTTSVQLLETLFGAGTRGARRMHQLANSVIIFDEVQTIPLRSIHLFNNAINFLVEHCASSVVLCTATQPLLNCVNAQKGAARFMPEDEIIPNVPRLFTALQRTEILPRLQPGGWAVDAVVSLAANEIKRSGSCLIIVNTRKGALDLYQTCSQNIAHTTYHLSTSMCPKHRREILEKIRDHLANDIPVLCISTQLIEAGVDVDFGAVIRYVAGLDSIAQAAGRCNRNGRRPIGRVHVINPAEEKIDRLIDIRMGRDVSMRLLAEYEKDPSKFDHDLLAPKAMATYFDYYFFQRSNEMEYPVSPAVAMRDDSVLNLLSINDYAVRNYQTQYKKSPPILLRHAFMTGARAFRAIDAPTQGIIVPYGAEGRELVGNLCGSFKPELQFDLLRRAQQFSVNVFPHVFDALLRAGAISEIGKEIGIFHLKPEYYNEEFGLSDTPTNPMEALYA
ncbi:MAG: CRISPR-associated helicase, Cas3 family [Solimicrobium sp.]|jgi:CRISPR-associated endonuclease/helicase Cas3|nr:CRISPR-associated helicase, Cas3 family [Solimicrobium sp.]